MQDYLDYYYNYLAHVTSTVCSIWIGTKVNHYCSHVLRAENLLFQIYGPKMRTFIFLEKKSTKMDFGFWPIFLKNRCAGVLRSGKNDVKIFDILFH